MVGFVVRMYHTIYGSGGGFVHESNIRRPLVVSACVCVCVCVLNIRYIFVIGPLVSEKLFFLLKKGTMFSLFTKYMYVGATPNAHAFFA